MDNIENRLNEIEQKIQRLTDLYNCTLHLFKDDICHVCHTKMEIMEFGDNKVASVYKCINPSCPNFNQKKIIDTKDINFLWYLRSHLE